MVSLWATGSLLSAMVVIKCFEFSCMLQGCARWRLEVVAAIRVHLYACKTLRESCCQTRHDNKWLQELTGTVLELYAARMLDFVTRTATELHDSCCVGGGFQ